MARRTSNKSSTRGEVVLMSRSVFCTIGGISERELASWEREDLIAPARVERVRGRLDALYDREALRRAGGGRTRPWEHFEDSLGAGGGFYFLDGKERRVCV